MRKSKKMHYREFVVRYSIFGAHPEFFARGYILPTMTRQTVFIELEPHQHWQTLQAAEEGFTQLARQRIDALLSSAPASP